MEKTLLEFFTSHLRNTWLFSDYFSVYVRKGVHLGSDVRLHTFLDIATIEVEPCYQHKGHFKAFLALCQQIQPYDGIIVENVLNDDLRGYLRRLTRQDSRWTERGEDFLWEKWNG